MIDPSLALQSLAAEAASDTPTDLPRCAPPREFLRSPAALRIGRMAARSGLELFHFEHRVHLPLPVEWVPEHDEDLADPPGWELGVLPEAKYQSFRHDSPLGSYHPGHRAKWSTHELCHSLVGFAWRPDASPFFHATASRLAELLPVALYYGFDEAFGKRCDRHAGDGALYRSYCPECEAAARIDPDDARAEHFVRLGLDFLDRELAAIARSRRQGRLIPHRHGPLNLCSDGVAYAHAHGARLRSDTFAAWHERFAAPVGWGFDSLDDLEARVIEVARGLLLDEPILDHVDAPEQGRIRWTAMDLGWRIGLVQSECEGQAARELDRILDELGAGCAAADADALGQAALDYEALYDDWELAPPDELFALGYPVPEIEGEEGRDNATVLQLAEGIRSCAPGSATLVGDGLGSAIRNLVAADRDLPQRKPLAERWVDVLEDDEEAQELARYEALLATAPRAPTLGLGGAEGPWRLVDGVKIEVFDRDVLLLAAGAERGERPAAGEPMALAAGRDAARDLVLAQIPPEDAVALLEGEDPSPETAAGLVSLGLLESRRLSETLAEE